MKKLTCTCNDTTVIGVFIDYVLERSMSITKGRPVGNVATIVFSGRNEHGFNRLYTSSCMPLEAHRGCPNCSPSQAELLSSPSSSAKATSYFLQCLPMVRKQ